MSKRNRKDWKQLARRTIQTLFGFRRKLLGQNSPAEIWAMTSL